MNPNGQPAATGSVPTFSYLPAVFHGAAPPPTPPLAAPLPWERKAAAEAEAKAKREAAERDKAARLAAAKAKRGFFNQLAAVAQDVANQTESLAGKAYRGAKSQVSAQVDQRAASRFLAQFPAYGAHEKLLFSTTALCLSGGAPIRGEAFVSANYLAFGGVYRDNKSVPGQVIKHPILASVPLRTIICVQPALAQWGRDKTAAPQIVPIGANQVPNALMVFCNDQRIHLLYNLKDFGDFHNVLDHQWRALVNAPQIATPQLSPDQSNYVPPTAPSHQFSEQFAPSAPPADGSDDDEKLYPDLHGK